MDDRKYNKLLSMLCEIKEDIAILKAEKLNERLSPKEVIAMLGISMSTYKRYTKNGKVFTQHKSEGRAYVLRSDIEKLKAEGKL